MATKFKQFKVYAPPSTKQYSLNDDGTLTITGVFSTTNEDLDGDIVSQRALASLQKQAVGLNLHLDHVHTYEGGIGVITDSSLEENKVYITAVILSEHAPSILERLNLGMNFGFSIGGIPVVNNINPQIIDDFVLLEISLTLLPANWDTFGTVEAKGIVKSKCLTGACHYIIKNSQNIMKKEFQEDIDSNELRQTIINYVNEAFANKEPVIIDEFKNELQPIVAEIVTEQVTPIVQQVVVNYLDELFPAEEEPVEEEEFVEAEVDEEVVETSEADEVIEESVEEKEAPAEEEDEIVETSEEAETATVTEDDEDVVEKAEDEQIEEAVPEEVEEKEAPTEEEDEIIAEEAVVESEAEEEVFDEPLEIEIEKEAPAEEEVIDETSEEVDEIIIDEKAIEEIVNRILAKKEKARKVKSKDAKKVKKVKIGKKQSKLNAYQKSTQKASKNNSFLNSPERDQFGRNKKYL